MKINSWPKLFAAMVGILVGLYLPEIWAFITSLFG
jgi:hypothetical protein